MMIVIQISTQINTIHRKSWQGMCPPETNIPLSMLNLHQSCHDVAIDYPRMATTRPQSMAPNAQPMLYSIPNLKWTSRKSKQRTFRTDQMFQLFKQSVNLKDLSSFSNFGWGWVWAVWENRVDCPWLWGGASPYCLRLYPLIVAMLCLQSVFEPK